MDEIETLESLYYDAKERIRELEAELDSIKQRLSNVINGRNDIAHKFKAERDRYRKALEFITASPVVDSRDIAYKVAHAALRGE
jgi:hypothetical protein